MKEQILWSKKNKETATMNALPSVQEIKAIEKRCENERNDAIWSVLVAPFVALKDLLDYKGDLGKDSQGTAGVVVQ